MCSSNVFVVVSLLMLVLKSFVWEVFVGRGLGALGMSTRISEWCVCLLNVFCSRFVDLGSEEFCMGGVRGRGPKALAMSTRVGELCVVELMQTVSCRHGSFCERFGYLSNILIHFFICIFEYV